MSALSEGGAAGRFSLAGRRALVTGAAAYVNGPVLTVDGGLSAAF